MHAWPPQRSDDGLSIAFGRPWTWVSAVARPVLCAVKVTIVGLWGDTHKSLGRYSVLLMTSRGKP